MRTARKQEGRPVSVGFFALALLLALPLGCSKRGETASSVSDLDKDARTAALVKKDPLAYIESQIAALESDSLKYGEIEKTLQWELQKRRKAAADVAASSDAAKSFGKQGQAILKNPAAVFPVTVEGRRFDSRNALVAELAAAKAVIQRAPDSLQIINNQIAKAKVRLDDIAKKRIAISSEITTLRHKADSARILAAQGKMDELDKMVSELVETANAALPDDEYFSPSFEDVGGVSLEDEVASFEF